MKQQRDTKQRQAVLEAVRARLDHPTADHIYMDVRSSNIKISRSTVYRNLNLLSEMGVIGQLKLPGADRFDWHKEPHYHLLCSQCDKVTNVSLPYDESLDRKLESATGFSGVRHHLHFVGVCPDCRQTIPPAE